MKLVLQIAGGIVLGAMALWIASLLFLGALIQTAPTVDLSKEFKRHLTSEKREHRRITIAPPAQPPTQCATPWRIQTTSGAIYTGCGNPPSGGLSTLTPTTTTRP